MYIAAVATSFLLAALVVFAAARKLTHRAEVVDAYARAGVPEDKLNSLALILFAGATGLIAGALWAPIGVAAAGAFVAYFIVAIGFHIRSSDAENLSTPVLMAALAAAALALRVASL
jgi:hypothetical protein